MPFFKSPRLLLGTFKLPTHRCRGRSAALHCRGQRPDVILRAFKLVAGDGDIARQLAIAIDLSGLFVQVFDLLLRRFQRSGGFAALM